MMCLLSREQSKAVAAAVEPPSSSTSSRPLGRSGISACPIAWPRLRSRLTIHLTVRWDPALGGDYRSDVAIKYGGRPRGP